MKGEVRGVVFNTDADFVERRGGKIEDVESRVSFTYSEIQAMEFYPLDQRIASLEAIKEVLDLDDEGVVEMGRVAPKTSLLVKMFARFFFSIEKTLGHSSEMWSKHYTVGYLGAERTGDKKITIDVEDIETPPIFTLYLRGYLMTIVGMVVGNEVEEVSFEEMEEGFRLKYQW